MSSNQEEGLILIGDYSIWSAVLMEMPGMETQHKVKPWEGAYQRMLLFPVKCKKLTNNFINKDTFVANERKASLCHTYFFQGNQIIIVISSFIQPAMFSLA